MSRLVHELIRDAAVRAAQAEALCARGQSLTYSELAERVDQFACGLVRVGVERRERVAIYLDKRIETVIAMFGTAAAGAVFVPVNPLYKGAQVAHILRDCNVRLLVTSPERWQGIAESLTDCHDLRLVALTETTMPDESLNLHMVGWQELIGSKASAKNTRTIIDTDMAAILYTSGSTGMPKGVVLSHRNIVTGADSVAQYLGNRAADRILAVLPFSFDYGMSQLTTAFASGACVVLLNYLLPRDVLLACEREGITGLAAVPPLWIQLSQLQWPAAAIKTLRYITNSGGAMPTTVVQSLRQKLPNTSVFLMYGLTEAFRSTYLAPAEIDRRPESIGKAIPNAEILVVRPDGTPCAPNEPGELVHRGALVAMGYWNDPARTAERFRPDPFKDPGITTTQLAVWSGDTVRMDSEGYLYFIGRKDDMIKTSGYRVSPSEIEEVVYGAGLKGEAVAVGVPHPVLGQAIVLVRTRADHTDIDDEDVLIVCRQRLPAFMVPAKIASYETLPRNPNGKIDRKRLAEELTDCLQEN